MSAERVVAEQAVRDHRRCSGVVDEPDASQAKPSTNARQNLPIHRATFSSFRSHRASRHGRSPASDNNEMYVEVFVHRWRIVSYDRPRRR